MLKSPTYLGSSDAVFKRICCIRRRPARRARLEPLWARFLDGWQRSGRVHVQGLGSKLQWMAANGLLLDWLCSYSNLQNLHTSGLTLCSNGIVLPSSSTRDLLGQIEPPMATSAQLFRRDKRFPEDHLTIAFLVSCRSGFSGPAYPGKAGHLNPLCSLGAL